MIRVFGIYTNDHRGGRLWESLGKQLTLKGSKYKERCAFRNKPRHGAYYGIPPCSFPLQEYGKDEEVSTSVNLPAPDQKDVSDQVTLGHDILSTETPHDHRCINFWCKLTSSLSGSQV